MSDASFYSGFISCGSSVPLGPGESESGSSQGQGHIILDRFSPAIADSGTESPARHCHKLYQEAPKFTIENDLFFIVNC